MIATDLHTPPELQLWPTATFALACGCTLLTCGVAADVLGCRRVYRLGGLFQIASALGAGLVVTSTQLIVLRVMVGLAVTELCWFRCAFFPANSSPRRRSIAFAATGWDIV
ncbi:hypothetical protein ASPWEDRAFT_192428 [Aspergillus wentii DTO 134E9]|uniref:Major facilitator superfamily (MFS) profile domain-containing protein n=1 Tax=Aspergillus wentii DTO 134E9 TaxID=1073089 RepID=A0A1L9RZ57_ASPWE|nr:uncharacterized protein ASPWEDRAFT_192428 [Aspergillus wentii DTO 134E9]KAI9932561.1 hypothetical protein MW887_008806 [Aspergillus wentii]OJJ40127.1 hypothetical protein ASPWEDRAFT_192428 [Aspergillus wentii DTO 134E9]